MNVDLNYITLEIAVIKQKSNIFFGNSIILIFFFFFHNVFYHSKTNPLYLKFYPIIFSSAKSFESGQV